MYEQKKRLPVVAGFILPNGELIEAAGIGHRKQAMYYINDHNLNEAYRASDLYAEDDFMVEVLGAMKCCMYRGKKFIYVPRIFNWHIKQMIKIYVEHGYELQFVSANKIVSGNLIDFITDYDNESYNRTVIEKVHENGKITYCYNPKRVGD